MSFFHSPVLWQCILGAGAAACFVVAWMYFKNWNLIRELPTKPINRVYSQVAEIKGRAVADGELFISPISQRQCVYYSIKVERYRSSGRSGSWVTELEQDSGDAICIEDGTGRARVMPSEAKVEFKVDLKCQGGGVFDGSLPVHVMKFLQNQGFDTHRFMGVAGSSFRCKEIFIKPGDELYVLGWGTKRDEKLVEFTKRKPYPLIISDFSENKLLWYYFVHWFGMAVSGTIIAVLDYYWITCTPG